MSQKAANATWRDISDISFEEGDRYLLANLIYCEAGGEPYDGQLAVASVVINRVRSSVYPNTVVGVIYQNKQFSPVASGRLELALAANKATSRCYQAADEAMSGVTNVGNCVYFRTPVEGLTGISIGGHIFTKVKVIIYENQHRRTRRVFQQNYELEDLCEEGSDSSQGIGILL